MSSQHLRLVRDPVPLPEKRPEPRRQPEAACRNLDEWIFEDPIANRIARAACNRCVLRVDCLKYELEMPSTSGIRGGLDAEQRSQIRPAYLAQMAIESAIVAEEA